MLDANILLNYKVYLMNMLFEALGICCYLIDNNRNNISTFVPIMLQCLSMDRSETDIVHHCRAYVAVQ